MTKILVFVIILLTGTSVFADEQDGYQLSLSLIEDLSNPPSPGLSASTIRAISMQALNFIADYEKWRPDFYDDAAGYCTIGYGHLIAKGPCENHKKSSGFYPLLEEKFGKNLLDKDALSARSAVEDAVQVPLKANQFDALVSFVFNVGKGHFRSSTLLKKLNLGEYDTAADEMRFWIKAGGVKLLGLKRRRACERALFLGVAPYQNGEIDREECEQGAGIAEVPDDQLIDISEGEK